MSFLFLFLSSLEIEEGRILRKKENNEFKKAFKRFSELRLKFSRIEESLNLNRIILIHQIKK